MGELIGSVGLEFTVFSRRSSNKEKETKSKEQLCGVHKSSLRLSPSLFSQIKRLNCVLKCQFNMHHEE